MNHSFDGSDGGVVFHRLPVGGGEGLQEIMDRLIKSIHGKAIQTRYNVQIY